MGLCPDRTLTAIHCDTDNASDWGDKSGDQGSGQGDQKGQDHLSDRGNGNAYSYLTPRVVLGVLDAGHLTPDTDQKHCQGQQRQLAFLQQQFWLGSRDYKTHQMLYSLLSSQKNSVV